MTPEEITALAREYAEELSPDNKVERKMIELDCLGFLDRVLNSYCLVEKSKIEEAYKACTSMRDDNLLPNIESAILHHRGMEGVRVLKSLFPEIAKEVEL